MFCKTNQGFSFVELLIASTMGLFLMAGITAIYFTQLKEVNFQQALNQIQDSERLATYFFQQPIRMAGFIGCGRLSETKITTAVTTIDFSALSRIVGYHLGKTSAKYLNPNMDPLLQKSAKDSDVLLVQFADPGLLPAHLDGKEIYFTGNNKFNENDVFSVSNCNQVYLFRVENISAHAITPATTISLNETDPLTQLSLFHSYVFYVADTGRKNLVGDSIYALCRLDLNGPAKQQVELLEGVRKMHIYFAVKNPQGKQYYTGDQVPDWQNVVGVKIIFLMQSLENVNLKPQYYQFDGVTYLASDRCLYKSWEMDVALRQPL